MSHLFEKALIEQCAPTLAGVKVASLFRISGLAASRACAQAWDEILSPMGLRVMVLKECHTGDACMIYVYREKWLGRLLGRKKISAFLAGIGYDVTQGIGMLSLLSRRFCLEQEYPHEIGVFLGYPLEDVVGFIQHKGHNYTCCGHWKCYGDPAIAQARFAHYRACTAELKQRYGQGTELRRLVVAAA